MLSIPPVPDLRFASSGMTRGSLRTAGDWPCHPGSAAGAVRDVGDVEADDAGLLQLGPEAALEFGAVGALHDEDDVGPCTHPPLSSSRRRPGPSGAEGDLFRQGSGDSFALSRAAGSRGRFAPRDDERKGRAPGRQRRSRRRGARRTRARPWGSGGGCGRRGRGGWSRQSCMTGCRRWVERRQFLEEQPSDEIYRRQGRDLLRLQCRALDALIQAIADQSDEHDEFDRVTIWMLQAIGVSANSILKLTETIDMSIRDCFGIARSAAETAVNVSYIAVGGPDLADRSIRHLRQKRWRDLKRVAQMGDQRITVERRIDAKVGDFPGLQEALDEFTNAKGHEVRDWTPDNIQKRIALVATKSRRSAEALSGAIFAIYRPSSELLHGSFYGVNYFWQGSLDRPVASRREFAHLWTHDHFVTLLTSIYFAVSGTIEAVAVQRGLDDHLAGQKELDKLLADLTKRMSKQNPSDDHFFTPEA